MNTATERFRDDRPNPGCRCVAWVEKPVPSTDHGAVWVLAQTAGTGLRGGTLSGVKGLLYFVGIMMGAWALLAATGLTGGSRRR
jgi:hypothetical protein